MPNTASLIHDTVDAVEYCVWHSDRAKNTRTTLLWSTLDEDLNPNPEIRPLSMLSTYESRNSSGSHARFAFIRLSDKKIYQARWISGFVNLVLRQSGKRVLSVLGR